MAMKITIPEEVLDEFFKVEPLTCEKYPRRGIPCVSCGENKECEQVESKEIEFGDGVMKRVGSSATLSIRMHKQGDLEEALLKQLVKGMVEEKKYMVIAPEETFDVTFFVSVDRYAGGQVTGQRQKKALVRSVLDFLASKPIEGRLTIHDWANKELEKLDHKVRREYKESWEEVEDVMKLGPTPVETAVRAAVAAANLPETQVPVIPEAGNAPSGSPREIIRFLKEDVEKGEAKYAQRFVESSDSGRPLIPFQKAEVPGVEKEYLPRKATVIQEVPQLPRGDTAAMLDHLEKLLQADLPARFIADRMEKAREEIRKSGYWGKAYLDIGSVARRMYQYHEGLALSINEKKQILEKVKVWKKEVQ
ncbi:MAG: hypothetical protein WED04_06385 [Promethearchaeati archaeon SRVP18_Atabeyarchaeia-1]